MVNFIDKDDVEREINLLEQAIAYASSQDEYMEAMLRNQKLLAQVIAQDSDTIAGDITVRTLPANTAGIALERIPSDNKGLILFDVKGYKSVLRARADGNIQSNEVVTVTGEMDKVEPQSRVDPTKMSFGSTGASSGSYQRVETQEDVTINPGGEETVLEIDDDTGGGIVEVGTNDQTYSRYDYLVNGESILESPIKEPLGLYNSPYRFPEPIQFDESFEVVVRRDEDAGGSKDYFSKVTYYR